MNHIQNWEPWDWLLFIWEYTQFKLLCFTFCASLRVHLSFFVFVDGVLSFLCVCLPLYFALCSFTFLSVSCNQFLYYCERDRDMRGLMTSFLSRDIFILIQKEDEWRSHRMALNFFEWEAKRDPSSFDSFLNKWLGISFLLTRSEHSLEISRRRTREDVHRRQEMEIDKFLSWTVFLDRLGVKHQRFYIHFSSRPFIIQEVYQMSSHASPNSLSNALSNYEEEAQRRTMKRT